MKHIGRFITVCLLVLMLCFATSCKKEQKPDAVQKDEKGTVYVLNGFESVREMFSVRPSIRYMNATMDIVDGTQGQVKSGEGSMRYVFEQGNWPELVLHIRHANYPELDIANLNKMNLSIYNDNENPAKCVVSVVVKGNKPLLTQEYTLEPGQWNELEFRLSSLACAFNADQITGFLFRVEAEEQSVFYFDDWSVTMGAENTQEDDRWEPTLLSIIDRINGLTQEPTLEDEAQLKQLYMEYAGLPELYRNIVPNYDLLKNALEKFAELKVSGTRDDLQCKFLAFDEFYGVGQLNSANYALLYQTDVKYGNDEGSIKITFDGSTKESYFPYQSPLDAKRYDYLEIPIYNDDVLRKVVYFNWNQRVVIEPQTWGTLKVVGAELFNEGNIIVDTIDAQGVRIQSRGTVYFGALRGYRRDLLAELKKLPDAGSFSMDRDIKYLSLIEKTMELYDKTAESERATLPAEPVENLLKCYETIAGYETVVDATQEDLEFGTPDCAAIGTIEAIWDEMYGPAWVLDFTEKAPGDYAAGFRFVKEFGENKNMFFYIYNPQSTAQNMELYADGNWKNLEMRSLNPGWNKIQFPTDVEVSHFAFGLFSKNADVVGQWKVSGLYSVSDALVNRKAASQTSALIQALPDGSSIKLPEDFRYVADIWQAYDSYQALEPGAKSGVPSALKNKLDACMKAIDGYKAAINPKTDEMTVGTPDCICSGTVKTLKDGDFGWVYELNITGIGTGDYAAGFQINKDISADRNLFFYIFNPKTTAQTMYLYADPSWDNLGDRVLAPGWNRIELPKDAKIDRYVFGLFPKNAEVTGQWKISGIYAKSDELISREEAAEASTLLNALPDASSIKMPEDLRDLSIIYAASDSYNALSDSAKETLSQEQTANLQACLQAVDGYLVAINALTDEMRVGTVDAPCQGTLDRIEDETYGPVFGLNITEAGSGDYAGGFQVNKDLSGYKHRFFYIYNPQASAQTMFLYADPSWKDLGARTLNPGWNLIELPDTIEIKQFIFGVFPASTEAVGQWKITCTYAVSDAVIYGQAAADAENAILALPDAAALTLADKASVDGAKTAYEALSDDAKQLVSQAAKDKLADCLAKIAELITAGNLDTVNALIEALPEADALTVADKGAVEEAKKIYDELSAEDQALVIHAEKLSACVSKIRQWKAWDEKTLVSAAVASPPLVSDGTVAFNVDDNTFGKVWTVTNGTFIKIMGGWLTGEAAELYIYNPTDSDVTSFYYTADWVTNVKVTLKAKSWTRVLIEDTNGYPFMTQRRDIYMYATFCEGYKVSSLFSAEKTDAGAAAVQNVIDMIQALPEAEMLTAAHRKAVEEAKKAYDALSAEKQAQVTNRDKLTACVEKLSSLSKPEDNIVVDASYQVLGVDGVLTPGVDDSTFGKVMRVSNSTYLALTSNVKNENAAFRESKNIGFYIYNPTSADVDGYYTMDWGFNAHFLLKAKSWSYIEFADFGMAANKQFITSTNTVYFYANMPGEGWLVSSFYGKGTDVAGLSTVVDASYQVLGVDGTLTAGADDSTFGKAMRVTNSTYLALTPNVKTENPAFKESKDIVFFIYNPQSTDVDLYYTMDWGYNAHAQLKANSWNRIHLSDLGTAANKQFITSNNTVYFYANMSGEDWLVSGFYGM